MWTANQVCSLIMILVHAAITPKSLIVIQPADAGVNHSSTAAQADSTKDSNVKGTSTAQSRLGKVTCHEESLHQQLNLLFVAGAAALGQLSF